MNKANLFKVIIKVKINDFLKIHQKFVNEIKITNKKGDYYFIRVTEHDLDILDNHDIPYEIISYQGLKYLLALIKRHISIVVGLIILVIFLYVQTFTIKDIRFSSETKDNERIEQLIRKHFKDYLIFDVFTGSIQELNYELRKEFSHFEWISVEKKGTVLYVKLLEPSIINKQIQTVEGYGDLVAKKDGIIKMYKIRHGLPLIQYNQFVRSGELLVTGNLRYNYGDESAFYVPSEGVVYAEVWDTVNVTVPKKLIESAYTGRIKTKKIFYFFGLNLTIKNVDNMYEQYDEEIVLSLFKIGKFDIPLGWKKIHYLEKSDIINIYDENTSLIFAESKIRYELISKFKEGEQIISINLINQSEDENNYYYTFFVQTLEDIAIFQRR